MSDRQVKEDEQQQHLQREQQDEEAIMPHDEEKEEEGQAKTSKRKRKRKRKKKSNHDDDDDDDKEEQTVQKEQEEMLPPQVEEDPKTKQVDRTVFVEGIPFTCTVDQVRDFFTTHLAGDNNPNNLVLEDIRCPVWHDSGRLRGYGHVVFGTTAARDAALALSGKYLQNRYLTIQKAQAPKGHGNHATTTTIDHSHPSATIVLHNLSYDATEDDITVVMEKFGSIAPGGVRIVRHSDSGRSKGFAYVSFENVETATAACQAAPISIAGRPCRLDYDHGRVRGSFRTADRKLWHKEFNHKRQKG